jgi:hypothetical protein
MPTSRSASNLRLICRPVTGPVTFRCFIALLPDSEMGTHINVLDVADDGVRGSALRLSRVEGAVYGPSWSGSAFAGRSYPMAARRSWKISRSML